MRPVHLNYSAAYSFANNVLDAVSDFHLGLNSEWIQDFFSYQSDSFFSRISSPNKFTLLNDFIVSINYSYLENSVGDFDGPEIVDWYSYVFESSNHPKPIWFVADQVRNHLPELRSVFYDCSLIISEAAFHLLFSDRTFLFSFSKMIAFYVRQLSPQDHDCFVAPGVVSRSSVPTWLKNAIFHRDKGHCQICGTDLTGIMVPSSNRHFDHMVPLKAGGTNDPTNFQLTCGPCNMSKGPMVYAKDHLTFTFW